MQPGVATLDIAVAGGTMPFAWAHEVNLFSLAIGTFVALVFFILIIHRLIHHEPLTVGLKPSMIILIAPFEVGFLGYTNFNQHIDNFASWCGVSFPMAALSSAALKNMRYMWILGQSKQLQLSF
jgi:tellurite resistance protein